ncbi:hypothetical protein SPRG_04854 [Saprolegnia parasitica CBS 223.65]|uniref:Fibronectin type-III domain-containing protein n=1 Tax=Saprolegnia parasitica (strain CBS 223.65) TaxID=695850 RepID=A0A067CSH9_SAPPC|nr:hypothetical protein SPRG_04854 [Saprolegnia parasitica CBS 223.65]KDO29737.1 hypothetical protein SPRG_04854 [Saprolegnia parasitica CBS 223.65]|eukprot:XP_012199386.1 hypothetical protein SPRG_04854 [Saprolegnia parasitica CBS 223.65]
MRRITTALVLCLSTSVAADVTLFPIPFYRGDAVVATTNVANTGDAWVPVQSLALSSANVEFVAYALPNYEGPSTVWRRNTSFVNSSATPIASYQVRPRTAATSLNTTANSSSSVTLWSYVPVSDGRSTYYYMVRNSSTSAGNPECLSTGGVNCDKQTSLASAVYLVRSVGDALQCGPASGVVAGTPWSEDPTSICAAARIALRESHDDRPLWKCMGGTAGVVGLVLSNSSSAMECVRDVPASTRRCTTFANQKECNTALTHLIGNVTGLATTVCGDPTSCLSARPSTAPFTAMPARQGDALSWQAGAVFGATGVLAILGLSYVFGPRRTEPNVNIEATCTSSCADDEPNETRYVATV